MANKTEKLPCSVDMKGQFFEAKTLVYVRKQDAIVGNTINVVHHCCFSGIPGPVMKDCKIIEVFNSQKELDSKIKYLIDNKDTPDLSPYGWIRITEQFIGEK